MQGSIQLLNATVQRRVQFMLSIHRTVMLFFNSFRMATLLSKFRIDFSDIMVLGDINTKPKKEK